MYFVGGYVFALHVHLVRARVIGFNSADLTESQTPAANYLY